MSVTSPDRPGAGRGGRRNPALDGLRAVAVSAVVYRHLQLPGLPWGASAC